MKKRTWISLLCCLPIRCCTGGTVSAQPDAAVRVMKPKTDAIYQALADKQTQVLEALVSRHRRHYEIATHPAWLTVSK